MQKIVLATNNPHKATEIREILAAIPYHLVTASEFPPFDEPEEDGVTLEENARIKAVAFYRETGLWALADDSGLEVDALDGAPGVMSARYAGPGCTFADNNRKLLELMEDVPDGKRGARFRCTAALAKSETDITIFDGTIEGTITREIHGDGGFGYDPVFYVRELGCTFAEVSAGDKNRLSHRGRAFRKVSEYLVAGTIA